MSNRSGRLGYEWERHWCLFLNAHGIPATRTGKSRQPFGDIDGTEWNMELKNTDQLHIPACLEQSRKAAARRGTDLYCVVYKNRGKSPAEAFVVMPASVFVRLLNKEVDIDHTVQRSEGEPGVLPRSG